MKQPDNLHIVVAMTKEKLIGAAGRIPWSLPEEMQLFKEMTAGGCVIMGRKTYESIGRPLPDRINIVISSSLIPTAGVETCQSFEQGLVVARTSCRAIFCIGGVDIYRQALPLATQLHISWIDGDFSGDTFFPEFDLDQWQESTRHQYEGFTQITYTRKQ